MEMQKNIIVVALMNFKEHTEAIKIYDEFLNF